jgi:hypothetical protein
MNKPKVLFVFDHPHEEQWLDGLWAALELLSADFEIVKWNLQSNSEKEPPLADFYLGWGGFASSPDKYIQELSKIDAGKFGLLIGGNSFPSTGMDKYDVLFYETKWVRDFLNLKFHPNIVHAFGVNTDIYSQLDTPTPILWDYIGVGAFANWKRWPLMLEKKGNRLVMGEYQLGNETESLEIVKSLVKGNVMVSTNRHPFDYAMLLSCSRKMYIPADIYGGGERAVLEARACGLTVEIEEDNPKLKELVEGPIYDHRYYAEQIKKGILSCL